MRLKLASRKSDLARWQAVQVGRTLEQLPEKPAIEFIFKASLGDQDLDTPLANMGAKGVFTEDFYADLIETRCDMVVHSWKDLPVELRAETEIAMTLPRADVRDVLVVPEEVWQKARAQKKLSVLTSSPRRVYNLGSCLSELLPGRPKIEFVNVRGNVPTRLGKMLPQNSALILAKAGLDRLLKAESEGFLAGGTSVRALIDGCRFMVLPLSLNPPAAAQGALAVEVLRANEQVKTLCAKLSDEPTYHAVTREREILRGYGGGCHQKIGVAVLPREFGTVLALKGQTDQGEILNRWTIQSDTPWTKAGSRAQIFPVAAKENSWFDRQEIVAASDLSTQQGLFVARAEALPESYIPNAQQILWTAGVQTWKRLAARGIWIHGTFDGLGENESPALDEIVGMLRWCKVSHARGHTRADMELVATYQLIPRKEHPDLSGKTHFFWMSSTSFERARQLFPNEVNHGYNACGPGSTFDHLRRAHGLAHPPKVFIGLEQFLAETLP